MDRVSSAPLRQAFATDAAGSGDAAALVPVYTRLSDAEENEQLRLAQMTDPRDAERRRTSAARDRTR